VRVQDVGGDGESRPNDVVGTARVSNGFPAQEFGSGLSVRGADGVSKEWNGARPRSRKTTAPNERVGVRQMQTLIMSDLHSCADKETEAQNKKRRGRREIGDSRPLKEVIGSLSRAYSLA
jgi:hypothetical protein